MMTDSITAVRAKEIINNLLTEICSKTDFPKDQWESWLKTEIGLSTLELEELKSSPSFPEPDYTAEELNERL